MAAQFTEKDWANTVRKMLDEALTLTSLTGELVGECKATDTTIEILTRCVRKRTATLIVVAYLTRKGCNTLTLSTLEEYGPMGTSIKEASDEFFAVIKADNPNHVLIAGAMCV